MIGTADCLRRRWRTWATWRGLSYTIVNVRKLNLGQYGVAWWFYRFSLCFLSIARFIVPFFSYNGCAVCQRKCVYFDLILFLVWEHQENCRRFSRFEYRTMLSTVRTCHCEDRTTSDRKFHKNVGLHRATSVFPMYVCTRCRLQQANSDKKTLAIDFWRC